MCGRYTLVRGDKIVEVIPNVTMPANLRLVGRYNVAPTQVVPVVANDSQQIQLFQWGLIPSWAKDAKIGNKLINARCETLAEKPAFRKALARRRCLIPADGFYEWQKRPGGKDKIPMYIRMRGGDLFAFAGLWESWKSPEGQEVKTFTIITTPPNELLRPIHDRMPAIIPREGHEEWLKGGEMAPEDACKWLKPYPAECMEAYPVLPLVNSPGNEGSELIEPAKGEDAAQRRNVSQRGHATLTRAPKTHLPKGESPPNSAPQGGRSNEQQELFE
jgi:putative SOS response-associated peptidase YedK